MNLLCYADDSGTHDSTGELKGAKQGLVGGIIAPVAEWPQFCRAWQAVLTKYNARYFHFCEWKAASAYQAFTLNAELQGRAGHTMEARVYWHDTSYVRLDKVEVRTVD